MLDAAVFAVPSIPPEQGARWCCVQFWQAPAPFAAAGVAAVEPLLVYANEGRWVVDCPDCNGAQLACWTDRRFMCVLCGNVTLNGWWRPIQWPADRAGIEAALEDRLPVNQNWLPGEPLGLLHRENESHGIGVI